MNGRVAAVLGVGPGLGAAVARRFAGEGFAVAMMARREESLAESRSYGRTSRMKAVRRSLSQPTPRSSSGYAPNSATPKSWSTTLARSRRAASWRFRPRSSTSASGQTAQGRCAPTADCAVAGRWHPYPPPRSPNFLTGRKGRDRGARFRPLPFPCLPECVEGVFSEVRVYGVLRSSPMQKRAH